MILLLNQEQGCVILLLDQEAGDPKSAQTRRKTASPSKVKGLVLSLAGALHMLGCFSHYREAFVSMVRNVAGPPGATAGVKV